MSQESQEHETEIRKQLISDTELIIKQNLSTAEANKSAAEVNRSLVELNESNLKIKQAETPEERHLRLKQLGSQNDLQINTLKIIGKFQTDQMNNLQTTFDIMFKQTKGAALMFYVSFWLGVVLIAAAVTSYLYFREPDNILTIAFFGVGALAMLSFFLRDPAVKVQQTAGKLVQLQFAMKCHLTEIGYWDIYITQQRELRIPIKFEELERASKSGWTATQSIMKQIDESLDDLAKGDKDKKSDQKE